MLVILTYVNHRNIGGQADTEFYMAEKTQPKQAPRRTIRGIVFVLSAGLSCLLLLAGIAVIQGRVNAQDAQAFSEPVTVSTSALQQEPSYQLVRRFTGRIEALQTTSIAFELSGIVNEVFVEEGDSVRKGARLAQLDVRVSQAELVSQRAARRSLVSALERARLDLQREISLDSRGFAADQALDNARLSVDQAEAALEQADAAIQLMDIALDKAALVAPFDGIVGTRWVDDGAVVAAGAPVLTLFDSAARLVRVGLPIDVQLSLSRQQPYTVRKANTSFVAQFKGARPDIEEATRTVDALFEIDSEKAKDKGAQLVLGELVELEIVQQSAVPGYWVPISALSEGERGLWSVLTAQINDEDAQSAELYEVVRNHINIVHTEGDQVYISALLPDNALIIDNGSHRVVAGQRVNVVSSRL